MIGSGVRRVARHVPGATPVLRRVDHARHVRAILASGIFDLEWYRAQTVDPLADETAAVQHYLTVGRRNGLTPNPLFAPSWYDPKTWATATSDPLARYLVRGPGRHGVHPLFDDAAWERANPQARSHRGRALGHFLSVSGPDTVLPTPPEMPVLTLAQVQSLMAEAEARWRADSYLARRRRSTRPDVAGERRLRARLDPLPAPTGGDGPLVSVVTPVRNRPTQILTAIASVQAQTLGDWELIVADDGSTDATADAVQLVADADHRIRVLRLPPGGVSAARNAAIAAARGRYVAFLDSDNTWVPDFLRLMTVALHADDLRAAYSALELAGDGSRHYLAFEGDTADLAYGNHVDLNTLVVERSLLLETGGFDTGLRRMVDYDLVVRLARRTELRLVPFVGAVYDSREEIGTRISTTESLRWDEVVKNRLFLDWDGLRRDVGDRVPGRLSVLLSSAAPASATLRAVTHLRRHCRGEDVEFVVLDDGGSRATWTQLCAALGGLPGVRLERTARTVGAVLAANTAFAASSGELVAVVRPEAVVVGPWAGPLLAAFDDPAVAAAAPPVVDQTGVLLTAGLAPVPSPTGAPLFASVLAGFPVEDAHALLGTTVPAVVGPVVALRAADVAAAGGLDPLLGPDAALADLLWRTAARRGPVHAVLVDAPPVRALSTVTGDPDPVPPIPAVPADEHEAHALAARSFPPPHQRQDGDPWRRAGFVATGPAPGQARRTGGPTRWAIKIAAPAGVAGDAWGDVHFAHALARALRAQGQQVAVDRRESAARPSAHLDDVVLVLRGLDRVEPQPGAVNLIWVISHPDQVDPAELAGFDHVFAAGGAWAERIRREHGVPVETLLQATDPDLFAPRDVPAGSGPRVLFVGNSRNVMRPMVRDALAARLPLALYGAHWERLVDPAVIAGTFVPNDRLAALYRSAGVVLNDHWDDMAHEGFLSNRLFDAVAAGARVITDPVAGLGEVFGPEVQVAAGPADLERLAGALRDDATRVPSAPFPDDDALAAASARVRTEHTFAARAARLVEVVTGLHHPGRPPAEPTAHAICVDAALDPHAAGDAGALTRGSPG